MTRIAVGYVATLVCLWWTTLSCCAAEDAPLLLVKRLIDDVRIDGKLDEACYKTAPTVTDFVVAGAADARPQPTKAWLFWQPERLVFAFEVQDKQVVAAPKSDQERDVDGQDRIELFLWSGRQDDTYYCLEVAARGALHDYAARFYRQFDDAWSPAGLQVAVTPTDTGYRVEAALPRAALAAAQFALRANETWHGGLFRADFDSTRPDQPTWICWVDARGPQPDFHVAQSFGRLRLTDETTAPTNPRARRSDP